MGARLRQTPLHREESNKKDGGSYPDPLLSLVSSRSHSPPTLIPSSSMEARNERSLRPYSGSNAVLSTTSSHSSSRLRRVTRKERQTKPYKWSATTKKNRRVTRKKRKTKSYKSATTKKKLNREESNKKDGGSCYHSLQSLSRRSSRKLDTKARNERRQSPLSGPNSKSPTMSSRSKSPLLNFKKDIQVSRKAAAGNVSLKSRQKVPR